MAGISILRRLLMKEAMKKNAPFQNEGIMSISKTLTTNVDSKVNKMVESAKRQGIDFDQYNEQQVKYILELNKPKGPRVISADSPEGRGITEALLGRKEGKVIEGKFGKPFAKEVESMEDIADARLIDDMYRTAGPRNLDEDAGYLAEFIAEDAGKIFDDLPAEQQRAFRLRARKALRKNVEKYKKFPTAKDPDFEDVGPFDNDAEKLAEIKMSNEGFIDDIITDIKQMEPIDSMKEANKVLKGEGRYKNLSQADREKIVNDESVTDHIFERDVPIDPEDMAEGGRAGFFMGSANPKGLGLLKKILEYMSKKGKETGGFKGMDISALDMLRLSNPKSYNKFLEKMQGKVNLKEGIMSTDMVRAQQQALRGQRKGLTEKSLDVAKAMKEDQDRIAKRIAKEAETTIIPEVKERLMKDMGMSEEVAEKTARDIAKATQNMKLIDSPPEITDEGILQLENVLKNLETGGKKKRELNATGGRIGLKAGMSKRAFLKLMGGAAAGIGALKTGALKLFGKEGAKNIPQVVTTPPVAGKPAWFDSLVNKVIAEGDDVTKKFATKEREIVHVKQLGEGEGARVTRDLDEGTIRVEYESPTNLGEEPVIMEYKPGVADEITGGKKPADEFKVVETEPQYVGGPEDADIEFIGENVANNVDEIVSDTSSLKQFATGKLDLRDLAVRKEKVKKTQAINNDPMEQAEFIENKYGPGPEPDDFASGGIARMLGE